MINGYGSYEGTAGFPRQLIKLCEQGFIFETEVGIAGRETEGLPDNIGRKGKNYVTLRRNESIPMCIVGVPKPDNKINTGMDLGGNVVIEARLDDSETIITFTVVAKQ